MANDVVLKVYSENGRAQVLGDGGIAFGLSQVGSVTMVDDGYNHPQPMVVATITATNAVNPVMAFRGNADINVNATSVNGGTVRWYLRAKSSRAVTVNFWIFDTAAAASRVPGSEGIEASFYDQFGVKTFDATAAVMRVAQSIETGTPPEDLPYGGFANLEAMNEVVVPPGRVYAVAQSTGAYTFTTYDTGAYSNSTLPPNQLEAPDSGEPPINARWRYQNLESYHSTGRVSGSSIMVGFSQFEQWGSWNPFSQAPTIMSSGNTRHLIIDVTDYAAAAGVDPTTVTGAVNHSVREVRTGGSQTVSKSTTPEVVATATGGQAPYTFEWQRVRGSELVYANGYRYDGPFSTATDNQPQGTTRESVWRARITDSQGIIGYSPEVTFRHIAEALDYTADAINPGSLNINTNEPTGWAQTPAMRITGTNAPVTLRVERYNDANNLQNMDRCYMEVHRSPNGVDQWEKVGTIQALEFDTYKYVDFSINPGWYFVYSIWAETNNGRRQSDVRMVVYNMTGNQTLSDVTQRLIVDADNNYSVPDYNLNPVGWENISGSDSRPDYSSSNSYRQLTGINRNVTLRATITGVSGNLSPGSRVEMFVGGNLRSHSTNVTNGAWAQADFAPNEYLAFVTRAYSADGQTRSGSYTVTVTNSSDGGRVIDTFTVNQTVAGADYTPDAFTGFTDQNRVTNDATIWFGPEHTVSGINRAITLRVERYNYTGDLSEVYVNVYTDRMDGAGWRSHGSFDPRNGGYQYIDIQVQNGWKVHYAVDARTSGGRRSGAWDMVVWDMTGSGGQLTNRRVNVTVDNDNNYWPPDVHMDPIGFSSVSLVTNDREIKGGPAAQRVTGINQTVQLRCQRWNETGNLDDCWVDVFRAPSSSGPWTFVGHFQPLQGGYRYCDFEVNNGDWFRYSVEVAYTNSGRRTADFDVVIYNNTEGNGAQLSSAHVAVVVDNDNNYNVVGPPEVSADSTYVYAREFVEPGQFYTCVANYQVNLSISGGQGQLSYLWERFYPTGVAYNWGVGGSITQPSFSYTGVTNWNETATYRLKVTDSLGRVGYSPDIFVDLGAGNAL